MFNAITAPLLSQRVITDCPSDMIHGLNDGPAHPSIYSKRQLLALVKHLAIEYPDLQKAVSATALSRNGGQDELFASQGVQGEGTEKGYKILVFLLDLRYFFTAIQSAWRTGRDHVDEEVNNSQLLLSTLETLRYASVFGSGCNMAQAIEKIAITDSGAVGSLTIGSMTRASVAATRFVSKARPRNFCHRPALSPGPFSTLEEALDDPGSHVNAAPTAQHSIVAPEVRIGTYNAHTSLITDLVLLPDCLMSWRKEDAAPSDGSPSPFFLMLAYVPNMVAMALTCAQARSTASGTNSIGTGRPLVLRFYAGTFAELAEFNRQAGKPSALEDIEKEFRQIEEAVLAGVREKFPDVVVDIRVGFTTGQDVCPACGVP